MTKSLREHSVGFERKNVRSIIFQLFSKNSQWRRGLDVLRQSGPQSGSGDWKN